MYLPKEQLLFRQKGVGFFFMPCAFGDISAYSEEMRGFSGMIRNDFRDNIDGDRVAPPVIPVYLVPAYPGGLVSGFDRGEGPGPAGVGCKPSRDGRPRIASPLKLAWLARTVVSLGTHVLSAASQTCDGTVYSRGPEALGSGVTLDRLKTLFHESPDRLPRETARYFLGETSRLNRVLEKMLSAARLEAFPEVELYMICRGPDYRSATPVLEAIVAAHEDGEL